MSQLTKGYKGPLALMHRLKPTAWTQEEELQLTVMMFPPLCPSCSIVGEKSIWNFLNPEPVALQFFHII